MSVASDQTAGYGGIRVFSANLEVIDLKNQVRRLKSEISDLKASNERLVKLNSSTSLARKSSITFAEPEQTSYKDVNPDSALHSSIALESHNSEFQASGGSNDRNNHSQMFVSECTIDSMEYVDEDAGESKEEEKKDTTEKMVTIEFDKETIGKEINDTDGDSV